MTTLSKPLRNELAGAVLAARKLAETAAAKALHALGVDEADPPGHLDTDGRRLRVRLRAQARQLGDQDDPHRKGCYEIHHLAEKIAYDHWHRLLFARFLAENDLLIAPDHGVGVSLADCEELAPELGLRDGWEVAARFAARMLPQIFRADDPAGQITFAPEDRIALRKLVTDLSREILLADDSLGWCYQFWQAQRKEEVNKAGDKIGADELAPVTQLFTEDYMVLFLLHNTLGAWWAGKQLAVGSEQLAVAKTEDECRQAVALPGVDWEYLRFTSPLDPFSMNGEGTLDQNGGESSEGDAKKKPVVARNFVTPEKLEMARKFRKQPTVKEADVWEWLRDRQMLNLKWRRQQIVEGFVTDFYCAEHHLALEIDGEVHDSDEVRTYDEVREAVFAEKGIRTIRIKNRDCTKTNLQSLLASALVSPSPSPFTSSIPDADSSPSPDADSSPSPDADSSPSPFMERGPGGEVPAAGTFDGWPKTAKELRVLDPCMGSGHFLVFELPILVAMRIAEEGLSREEAIKAVLRDNLFGLELDPRCTQIAAFNLALAAWKLAGRHIPLPPLNLACCGLGINASKEDWIELADQASDASPIPPDRTLFSTDESLLSHRLRSGMERLYDLFKQAPVLGSLIQPNDLSGDLVQADFHELLPLLKTALETEDTRRDPQALEMAVTAQGLTHAAEILSSQFTLVATNVPYLGRGKQDDALRTYCESHHPDAKADIATCFVERCLIFCANGGSAALVSPQNWLFLSTYEKLRRRLLRSRQWDAIARLGANGFQTPMWDFNVMLITMSRFEPAANKAFSGLDVADEPTPAAKAELLTRQAMISRNQIDQLDNPDARVVLTARSQTALLDKYANAYIGLHVGDWERHRRGFWEVALLGTDWRTLQNAVTDNRPYAGLDDIIYWPDSGKMHRDNPAARVQGKPAWDKRGVAISLMAQLPGCIYAGGLFRNGVAVISPHKAEYLNAIWAFCHSSDFHNAVRQIDQKLYVTCKTLVKVPFDLAHWQKVAAEKYPDGLPKPHSDDPTQWLFYGHPNPAHSHGMLNRAESTDHASRITHHVSRITHHALQIAVARLLGYQWPRQTGSAFPDCPALGPDGLEEFADPDGIVCISAIHGERPAAERLRELLAAAFGPEWSAAKQAELLSSLPPSTSHPPPSSLDDWLRNGFFEQHCQLFHQRPFIWHIWDGLRDGFSVLVNYHRLNRTTLEKLTYTYLGDWIGRQKAAVAAGEEGSDAKLAAAQQLQTALKLIIEGESPYDIFVRWKPLGKQPIGWEPDLNDGVRMNIRPFLSAPDVGRKGAGILRWAPKIKWDKDRGKDVPSAPWFKVFQGDRINDHHLTLAEKREAREKVEGGGWRDEG